MTNRIDTNSEQYRATKRLYESQLTELQFLSQQFTPSAKTRVNFLLTSIRIYYQYFYDAEEQQLEANAGREVPPVATSLKSRGAAS